jgi:hypothetical protein
MGGAMRPRSPYILVIEFQSKSHFGQVDLPECALLPLNWRSRFQFGLRGRALPTMIQAELLEWETRRGLQTEWEKARS